MFVSLSATPVALTGSDEGRALLALIRGAFGELYDVHECEFDSHPSIGRGTSARLEWREPAMTFADALVIAPLRPFEVDMQFELRRPPTVFPIPAILLQRWTGRKKVLDVGNVTVSSEAPVKHVPWHHANYKQALKLTNAFFRGFGLPFNVEL